MEHIDGHFNQNQRTAQSTYGQIATLQKAKELFTNFPNLKKEQFYKSHHVRYDELNSLWSNVERDYSKNLSFLIDCLKHGLSDIFNTRN
jgi:hypothetical protein